MPNQEPLSGKRTIQGYFFVASMWALAVSSAAYFDPASIGKKRQQLCGIVSTQMKVSAVVREVNAECP